MGRIVDARRPLLRCRTLSVVAIVLTIPGVVARVVFQSNHGGDYHAHRQPEISSMGERMRYGFRMELIGVTQEQYDAMHAQLAPIGADADGFIAHIAGPTQGGWHVIEVWESKADFERFAQRVAELMPPDAPRPHIEEFEVYSRQTKDQMIA